MHSDATYHLTLSNATHFAKQGGENWVESTLVPTFQAFFRGGGFKKNLSLTEKFGNCTTEIRKLNSKYIYSQLHFPANRNADLAVPPLFWPVNCIKIGGHVALLSCRTKQASPECASKKLLQNTGLEFPFLLNITY